jgi:ferredoxin
MAYVITNECNQCGACVAGCETGAVKEGSDQNVIDLSLCVECGLCHGNCPFGAIVWEDDAAPASNAG